MMKRRNLLKMGASALAALSSFELLATKARAQVSGTGATPPAPAGKLLFVVTATGGGSIVDSFMAMKESEAPSPALRDELICYPDAFVNVHASASAPPGNELRSLDVDVAHRTTLGSPGTLFMQSAFVNAHLDDIAVMAVENTSVNHFIAQHRQLTGAGVDGGRTIGERVAERYGQGLALPHVNMGSGGFIEPGTAADVAAFARHEPVVVPALFAMSTDGVRGMVGAPGAQPNLAPTVDELARTRAILGRARAVRDELDDGSMFAQTYRCSGLRNDYNAKRAFASASVEPDELIKNLFFINEVPVDAYGLELTQEAADARAFVEAMPGGMPNRSAFTDPWYAQIVLAYLLARYGYSCAVTLGVPFSTDPQNLSVNPPLSFDYSHNNHVAGQAQMWARVLDGTHKLISLLKSTALPEGGTMWDRSLVYIASDFGRDKVRSSPGTALVEGTSTGHP